MCIVAWRDHYYFHHLVITLRSPIDVEADAAEESQDIVDKFFEDAQKHFGDIERQALGTEKRLVKVFAGRQKASESADVSLNNW